LRTLLRDKIASGEIPPGRPLPSQRSLVETHGLARGTVAHAVRVLVDEGLVVIVPGKGAYVPPKRG
jgi:GntR family transcriptional regulator